MAIGVAQRGVPDNVGLSSLDIFRGVAPDLLGRARRREYRHGQVLLASGADADRLIVLIRGAVGIIEKDVLIALRPAVRLLGELAFIDRKPRSASVVAQGAVVTYEFDAASAEALYRDDKFAHNLNRELAWKLRDATSDRSWRYRAEEQLFGAFREHVDERVLQDLLTDKTFLEPREAEIVALFLDVRDFTRLSQSTTPSILLRDLSAILDSAVGVVHRHGGLVDKFTGDGLMAIWGYRAAADDPKCAVSCALDLLDATDGLPIAGERARIGIGLEFGVATLGVIGGTGKRQFTALGPPVNIAARLQEQTKLLEVDVCLGSDLRSRVSDQVGERFSGPVAVEVRGVGRLQTWTHRKGERK